LLAGKATIGFTKPRVWTLNTQAQAVNPGALWRNFPGKLDFSAEGKGTGLDTAARFSVDVRGVRGTLREQPMRGSGAVTRDAKGWQIANADVHYGDAHMNVDGVLRDKIDAHWSISAPTLSRLFPQAHGALSLTGSATGPLKTPHVIAKLDGSQLRYEEWSASNIAIDGDVDAAGQQPSRLTASATRIGLGRPMVDSLRIVGNGMPAEHRITIDAVGMKPNARQAAQQASVIVTGNFQDQIWNAVVASTQITSSEADQAVTMAEPTKLLVSAQRAALDNMCLVIAAGRLCANGKWERNGPWEATLAGYEIPLAIVLPPSGEEAEYAGRIEGRVHASGLPDQPWQGEAGMRIIDAAIVYTPKGAEPETLQLGSGGLAATATSEKVEFSFGVQAFTDTFLYANAHLQRDGSNDLLHIPLTGDMRGRAGDANILPLLFPDIDHAAGVLTGNANFTGSLALPEVSGRVELTDGEFDSYRVNLALRNIALGADVASNSLNFSGHGKAGDGQLEMNGHFSWHDGASSGALSLRGTNLLIADLPEYRVVASPNLKFTIDGNRLDAAGEVTIPSALVQPAKLTGAVRASADARYADETVEEREGRLVVHGDINIKMGDDVRVDAFGLQGRILGGVSTVTQTGEDPVGRGELSVDDGRYEAYGQKLGINRGRLLFEASPLDDPGLDIEARRDIDAVTVGLNVRGTLQEPRITFFSDPSMPQTQIVSYLLVGKSMDTVASTDTGTINSARSSMAMQGGGLIASQLGHRIGIEEVGVESSTDTSGQTNTALVLGKFLSPRLFISYGISLTESINTLKLRYTLSDKWVLKTEAGEFQSADVEYSIER
jgi:translocation and assembly module TamB